MNLTFPGSTGSFNQFLGSETTLDNKMVTTMMEKYISLGMIGLDRSNNTKFSSIRLTSTMSNGGFQKESTINELYQKFENFKDHVNANGTMTNAPVAFQTAESDSVAESKWV